MVLHMLVSKLRFVPLVSLLLFISSIKIGYCGEQAPTNIGNFGLPGIIDLPTAKSLPDGELIVTQQIHRSLARTGLSFQALPGLGVSFRYSGHGTGGSEAYDRVNHDRSFDAQLAIFNEGKYIPALSIGLRAVSYTHLTLPTKRIV